MRRLICVWRGHAGRRTYVPSMPDPIPGAGSHLRPVQEVRTMSKKSEIAVLRNHADGTPRRLAECAARNPGGDETHQSCCRFPKTCSPYPYPETPVTEADLEPRRAGLGTILAEVCPFCKSDPEALADGYGEGWQVGREEGRRNAEAVQCGSHYRVAAWPSPQEYHPVMRCLLAPHGDEFSHYAARPGKPDRFWIWTDAEAIEPPSELPASPGQPAPETPGAGRGDA